MGAKGGTVFGWFTDYPDRVVFYKRGYDQLPEDVFQEIGELYENRTDTQTDFFDEGHLTIPNNHPLYKEAVAVAKKKKEHDAAAHHKRMAKYGYEISRPECPNASDCKLKHKGEYSKYE